nr:basic leucine zipper 61-like [Ipomoea batatas]
MAQLPPRVPNMAPNWHDFALQKPPPPPAAAAAPSWVDEFLDFSSAKRGSHRRSISDSIAFLESPMVEECRRLSAPSAGGSAAMNINAAEFERFDDEQLMSMFNDDIATSIGPNSNPSSPSDHNSINEDTKMISASDHHLQHPAQELKTEPEEVQSSCKSDDQTATAAEHAASAADNSSEKIVDPKRIKRILANRQSAQRSRVRKLQYISELERSVTTLQAEVSVLSPRVAFLDHQRLVLNVDNSVLKQRIAALAQDKVFKDAHQDALKREIERLRQIYYQQNLKKMEDGTPPQPPPAETNGGGSEKEEQLAN